VRFRCADLRTPTTHIYDLVLLRHVLFHLPPTERVRILAGAYFSMRPQAHLVLGASEQLEEASGLFEQDMMDDHCFYRPVSAGRN
jgi:chemotaxis methyl-accepting protein methylase